MTALFQCCALSDFDSKLMFHLVAEFLSIFREQRHNKANALARMDTDMSEAEDEGGDLVGTDIKIPGRIYDSAKSSEGEESALGTM